MRYSRDRQDQGATQVSRLSLGLKSAAVANRPLLIQHVAAWDAGEGRLPSNKALQERQSGASH